MCDANTATFASARATTEGFSVSDVSDLVPSLQRAVAPPGQFDTLYPQAGSNDMVGLLLDGLAEATLDGFFVETAVVWTDDGFTTPDLTRAQQALIVIYAAYTFLRSELKNTNTSVTYKAGPVEYQTQSGASVITEILKEISERKKALIIQQSEIGVSAAFHMADSYFINAVGDPWCGFGWGGDLLSTAPPR